MSQNEKELSKAEDTKENVDEAEVLDEILDSVPQEHRKTVERMIISSSFQMRSIANPETAVMNKITEEHISQFLTGSREEMQYSYKEKSQKKIFTLLALVLVMAFCIIIICLLKDSPDIMEKVLYAVGGVVAGAFGGYGYGKNRREDD